MIAECPPGHMHEQLPPLQMDGSEKMNSHLSAYVVVYGPVGCRSDHSSEYNDPKGGKISGACHYYFFLPSNVFTHCAFVCSHPASPHPPTPRDSSGAGTISAQQGSEIGRGSQDVHMRQEDLHGSTRL